MSIVEEALADVLDDVEPWERDAARQRIREQVAARSYRRYVEKWGVPPFTSVSTDFACWRLLSPIEQAIWAALNEYAG